jgi:hypothetical protein
MRHTQLVPVPLAGLRPFADVTPQPSPEPAAVYGFLFGGCCFVLFIATAVVALIILIRRRNHDPGPPADPDGGPQVTEQRR